MDLFESEEAVKNGEITDFRPYVEGGTFHENRDRKALCMMFVTQTNSNKLQMNQKIKFMT